MEPGQDPADFVFVLDEGRDLLEKMEQIVHDERYRDIILHALPHEYERPRTTRYESRDLGWTGAGRGQLVGRLLEKQRPHLPH